MKPENSGCSNAIHFDSFLYPLHFFTAHSNPRFDQVGSSPDLTQTVLFTDEISVIEVSACIHIYWMTITTYKDYSCNPAFVNDQWWNIFNACIYAQRERSHISTGIEETGGGVVFIDENERVEDQIRPTTSAGKHLVDSKKSVKKAKRSRRRHRNKEWKQQTQLSRTTSQRTMILKLYIYIHVINYVQLIVPL